MHLNSYSNRLAVICVFTLGHGTKDKLHEVKKIDIMFTYLPAHTQL